MNAIVNTLVFVSMAILSSCVDKHIGEPLTIKNNSDQRIYYWFSYWKTENYTSYHYPDTVPPAQKPVELFSVAPHNAAGVGEDDPDWEKIFSELPEGKFSIYFFLKLPETQSEWELVRQTYDLVRKDVTYQEHVNNHWTITYP